MKNSSIRTVFFSGRFASVFFAFTSSLFRKVSFLFIRENCRISCVPFCDIPMETDLHDGKIAESGTHEQLLKLGGKYTAMWNAEQSIAA